MRERARGRWGSRRGGSRDAVSLAALGTRRERGVGNREARVRSGLAGVCEAQVGSGEGWAYWRGRAAPREAGG